MLRKFLNVARFVLKIGGSVSFEWPRYSDGWKLPEINQLLKICPFEAAVDGCASGVMSKVDREGICEAGQPIKKPWRFVSSILQLAEALKPYRCSGKHIHATCEWYNTKQTGFYPLKLAKIMVNAIFSHDEGTLSIKRSDRRKFVAMGATFITETPQSALALNLILAHTLQDWNLQYKFPILHQHLFRIYLQPLLAYLLILLC